MQLGEPLRYGLTVKLDSELLGIQSGIKEAKL